MTDETRENQRIKESKRKKERMEEKKRMRNVFDKNV